MIQLHLAHVGHWHGIYFPAIMATGGGGSSPPPEDETAFSVAGDEESSGPDIEVIEEASVEWPKRRKPLMVSY